GVFFAKEHEAGCQAVLASKLSGKETTTNELLGAPSSSVIASAAKQSHQRGTRTARLNRCDCFAALARTGVLALTAPAGRSSQTRPGGPAASPPPVAPRPQSPRATHLVGAHYLAAPLAQYRQLVGGLGGGVAPSGFFGEVRQDALRRREGRAARLVYFMNVVNFSYLHIVARPKLVHFGRDILVEVKKQIYAHAEIGSVK
nr:hypothetical protein [Tanacetum cinerariifolium]